MAVRVGSVLVGLTVLMAGCSSEQAPASLPPLPSAAASPSAAGLPSPPPAALQGTSEGASAFATFYFDLLNYALHSADVAGLERYSDPGCGGCRNLISAVRNAAAEKRRTQGADIVVLSAASPALQGGETIVDLRYKRSSGAVVDPGGRAVQAIPAQSQTDVQLRVRRVAGAWIVLGYRKSQP